MKITNHKSQITNHKSQITNHKSQITNHKSQITALIVILFTLFNLKVNSQTIIPSSGNPSLISTNTTWFDPVYYIYDDVVVNANVTLTISDGVQLIFMYDAGSAYPNFNASEGNPTKTGIFVKKGGIFAWGLQNSNITMTAGNTTTGWEGINIGDMDDINDNSVSSMLNFCIIEYVVKDIPTSPIYCTTVDQYKYCGAISLINYNNITIQNSIIRNNNVNFLGGGIYIREEATTNTLLQNYPIINNNSIYNNTALRGGGIAILKGENQTPYIANNYIYNNTGVYDAGGIAVFKNSSCKIYNNSIHDNIAECQELSSLPEYNGGGGIVIGKNSNAIIGNNNIYNNEAYYFSQSSYETGLGGGILIRVNSNAELYSNYIYNNEAYKGGGIAVFGNKIDFLNPQSSTSYIIAEDNEIYGNYAELSGGGIIIDHSFSELSFNNIYNNIALNNFGGGIHINANRHYPNIPNNPNEIFHNNIYSNFSNNGRYLC